MLRILCWRKSGAVCVVADDTDYLFLSSDEWLEVGLAWIVAAPDLDVADEVRVGVGVVEFLHDVDVHELVWRT